MVPPAHYCRIILEIHKISLYFWALKYLSTPNKHYSHIFLVLSFLHFLPTFFHKYICCIICNKAVYLNLKFFSVVVWLHLSIQIVYAVLMCNLSKKGKYAILLLTHKLDCVDFIQSIIVRLLVHFSNFFSILFKITLKSILYCWVATSSE